MSITASKPTWTDGKWTVEIVRLELIARPSRWSDPEHGDGEYFLARAGNVFAYASSVPELVAKTGIDLRELREKVSS